MERLLLPFGKNGHVKIIVASLQLISLEGSVERPKVVEKFQAHADVALSIRISAASFKESQPTPADRISLFE